MKCNLFVVLGFIVLALTFNSCSDDNSPSVNNTNGGGNNTGGCGSGSTSVADIDGNFYNVVTIGNQCWMKENLKTTRYKNGTNIPTVTSDALWVSNTVGACSDYDNDPANTVEYGKLYNWYAVANPAGLCPTGWHEPEEWEWNVLIKNLDASADTINHGWSSLTAGGAMKELGLSHWVSPNTGATNSSSFTALSGGARSDFGAFVGVGTTGDFWSSTENNPGGAWSHWLENNSSKVGRGVTLEKIGLSVRCVKD